MARQRRPLTKTKPPKPAPVIVTNPLDALHPGIRETALRVAGGDARRIEVVSWSTAVIR